MNCRVVAVALASMLVFGFACMSRKGNSDVLLDRQSLKVTANNRFPEDLRCEILVGEHPYPEIITEGNGGQVDSVCVLLTDSNTVRLSRNAILDSNCLLLQIEDSEGRMLAFIDIDMNGQWDVKKTPTREEKEFIFLEGEWVLVSQLSGLLSQIPTATVDNASFEFDGEWKETPVEM